MTESFPRGSEWRRWDLHVHTPFSALNNGFGQDFDEYAKRLLQEALARDVAAIGITDYFILDGYRALRDLVADDARLEALLGPDASPARNLLLLPNIELRESLIVTRRDGSDSRVNFHVIFDNELVPEFLEEHFCRELQFTAESGPSSPDDRWSLTRTNLQALGSRLKEEHDTFADMSDVTVGMMNAVVSHEHVTTVLERQGSRFKGRYLLLLAADEDLSEVSWDGQGHQARKLFVQKSHMLFSSNRQTREFALGRRHASVEAFIEEFKSLKPCVLGSDAHDFKGLFAPVQNRWLWIKADATFQGLRQLIYEPESRVYIGEEPMSLRQVRERATRFIANVEFERSTEAMADEQWFQGSVPILSGSI